MWEARTFGQHWKRGAYVLVIVAMAGAFSVVIGLIGAVTLLGVLSWIWTSASSDSNIETVAVIIALTLAPAFFSQAANTLIVVLLPPKKSDRMLSTD